MEGTQSWNRILAGQILLVVCSVIYLIWWSISFRPGQQVNRTGGLRGVLLLVTAAAGLSGVYLSVAGLNAIPKGEEKLNGVLVCILGIALYFIMMAVTVTVWKRPVTTELVLITGFLVLEVCTANALNAAGRLSDTRFLIALLFNAAAYIAGMVLYVLYYRVEEWRAFYLAMVPLAVDGAAALLLALMMFL